MPFWPSIPLISGSYFFSVAFIIMITTFAIMIIYRTLREHPSKINRSRNEFGVIDPLCLDLIESQYFRNERVVLDGKKFVQCSFHNVLFEYNGGCFYLDKNSFYGFTLSSRYPQIERAWALLQSLDIIRLPMNDLDDSKFSSHGVDLDSRSSSSAP